MHRCRKSPWIAGAHACCKVAEYKISERQKKNETRDTVMYMEMLNNDNLRLETILIRQSYFMKRIHYDMYTSTCILIIIY